ncbi:hypothetical protein BB560_003345 [Smittium megazygosporum]|uniref:Uncharacterized protein n=1 Tax=Smittium megazygosporum TaxID=133381 RepID=A0A2T9ZC78_9FUNG|nr:hypothetical protein BB560_003345 [Smittium megazygosporum]
MKLLTLSLFILEVLMFASFCKGGAISSVYKRNPTIDNADSHEKTAFPSGRIKKRQTLVNGRTGMVRREKVTEEMVIHDIMTRAIDKCLGGYLANLNRHYTALDLLSSTSDTGSFSVTSTQTKLGEIFSDIGESDLDVGYCILEIQLFQVVRVSENLKKKALLMVQKFENEVGSFKSQKETVFEMYKNLDPSSFDFRIDLFKTINKLLKLLQEFSDNNRRLDPQ